MKGVNIEQKSFDIIDEHVDLGRFDEKEKFVVKRIIHASGDFEFANSVIFSKGAVEQGMSAVSSKWDVVCDVNMVKIGITEDYAKKCSPNLHCFINEPEVVEYAKKNDKTRAESSIIYANEKFENIIFVIGNAPTALLKIVELYRNSLLKPSFVAAFPVGFVDAVYSKELLCKTGLDFITNKGTKGGSAVAASAFRAILKMVCGDL